MSRYQGIYEAVGLEGWGFMRLAGASGGLGKTAAPGWGSGEILRPGVANAYRCECLL